MSLRGRLPSSTPLKAVVEAPVVGVAEGSSRSETPRPKAASERPEPSTGPTPGRLDGARDVRGIPAAELEGICSPVHCR